MPDFQRETPLTTMTGPLSGLTILDFSHALAGPYCSMLMAAYGADVIKIEGLTGDISRSWGPPFQGVDSAYFVGLNSGKRSVQLDLKSEDGLNACRCLASTADILLENFRPGTLARLGLDYTSLSKRNSRLIYVSISGYGQTGPRKMEPAMDIIIQAASGLMSVTGTPDGQTVRTGHSIADITAGLFALVGSLLAIEARHKTGRGQFVDVSMMDSVMSTMVSNYARFFASKVVPGPMGTSFDGIVPYRNFSCADREITIAVASDKLWQAFCDAIGRPDLATHRDYCSNPLRVKNRTTLEPLLATLFLSKPATQWIEVLSLFGVPCTLVRNFDDVMKDKQVDAREMTPQVDHPTVGPIRVIGVPVKLSDTPGRITKAAPLLGADKATVLDGSKARNG